MRKREGQLPPPREGADRHPRAPRDRAPGTTGQALRNGDLFVEAMNEGAAALDSSGVILHCNTRFAQMLGRELERVVGSSLRDHLLPADAGTLDALIARARGEGAKGEVALDGGARGTIRLQLSLRGVPSSPETVAVVATDLSEVSSLREALRAREESLATASRELAERKRIEEALRRSEAVLRHAGEMAHVGAWWIEFTTPERIECNPLRWSGEVYRILGHEPGSVEVSTALAFERVHPDDRQRVREAFEMALRERRLFDIEHRIVRPDGCERTVVVHAEFVFDAGGRPLRVAGAVQDITEQKRIEEELRDSDRRKDEFLAVLSHELRNPLTPVRGALEILDRSEPGSKKAERAKEIIARQVVHLTRLVDDLLDVTRVARGKIRLQRVPFDLVDVVRRVVEDHRALFATRAIDLHLELAAEPLPTEGDIVRIAQVVGNLLHNAAKFTLGGGRVTVGVTRAGDHGVIRVVDSGVGIAPHMRSRLFEPFFQADAGLSRSAGGLGLGLALAKGIVELHAGTVEARSDGVGKGAEFLVQLPLVPELPRRAEPVERPSSPRRRVLVVEDNVDAAETLRMVLEMEGHDVDVAYDGREGLARARTFQPQVVLCDIGLPVMDGFALARTLRADEALRSTYLVALTGYALPEDQRRAAEAGFDLHIAKPPTLEQIQDAVARAAAR